MPSASDGPPVLPPVPGTPDGPAGYDPGVSPSNPWWVNWLHDLFGGLPPIDAAPPVHVDPGGGPMVRVPSPIGDDPKGGFAGIEGAIQKAIGDLEAGLPIFGTFALLILVFLIGLVMFLSESGAARPIRRAAAVLK